MRRVSICFVVALFLFTSMFLGFQASSQPQSAATQKDAMVRSFKIHYLEAGSGVPVILLHGLGGDGSRWSPNIKPLSADFRVIAPDHIGFGQSDKPFANYNGAMLAQFLAGFMKSIGVPKASIVGNSMGGTVAIYFAVHYPEMVDRLVLVDGGGYRSPTASAAPADPHRRQISNATTFEDMQEFTRLIFHDKSRVTDKMVDDNLILRLRSAFAISKMAEAGAMGTITEAEARSIKAPTLVIWGKYDELSDPSTADKLHAAIPGSQKILMDNVGHVPQLENPTEFNRIVKQFLKGDKLSTSSQGK